MQDDSQLLSMKKACEFHEQRAVRHMQEVEVVVKERQGIVDELKAAFERCRERVEELSGRSRRKAVFEGDVLQLHSISDFSERLRQEKAAIELRLADKQKDLDRAKERAAIAEKEVLSARLEGKRIERLLQERSLQAVVRGSALEEAADDELVTGIRKKPQ